MRISSQNKSYSAIQVLRCVAALLVVLRHSPLAIKHFAYNYWPEVDAVVRAKRYPYYMNHLNFGVDIFFCISGFIMCMLATRSAEGVQSGVGFLLRRVVRIFPPYWLFTAIITVTYYAHPAFNLAQLSGDIGRDAIRIVSSLFLVPIDGAPVLGVGWTLIHEFQFYLLVGVLICLGLGKRLVIVLGVYSTICLLLSVCGITVGYGYVASPYLFEFFMGALAYKSTSKISLLVPEFQLTLSIILFGMISWEMDRYVEDYLPAAVTIIPLGIMGFLMISGTLGVFNKYDLGKIGVSSFMARMGDASYSLYLVHWIILSYMGKLIVGRFVFAPKEFILMWHVGCIILACGFSLWFAEKVELPLHERIAKKLAQ